MSDDVKKIAIPTLGAVLVATVVVGAEPWLLKTVVGLFCAAAGLPMVGMIANAVGIKRA